VEKLRLYLRIDVKRATDIYATCLKDVCRGGSRGGGGGGRAPLKLEKI
jgi:hypothetical protein